MSHKRKYHSINDEDKEIELRKKIRKLKKRIDRQKKDRSFNYGNRRRGDHEYRSYRNYHRNHLDGRYCADSSKRSEDRDYFHDRHGHYSSRSRNHDKKLNHDRSRSPNRSYIGSRGNSRLNRSSRESSISNDRSSASSYNQEKSNSPRDVDPEDVAPINDSDQHNLVSQLDQIAQSDQVIQASTSAQGQIQIQQKSTLDSQNQKELDLDPEILEAIGERIHPDRKLAPAIHSKFVAGIEEVIKKGLPTDKRKILIDKFPSPENCLMMDPPKLNPELKACLQETLTKRDGRIVEKQVRITTSIAGLLNVFIKITSLKSDEKLPTKELTESLWGILQLMADLQHAESSIRRSLILKNINASMKETLNATAVDEWLFGEKLDEKVKATKTLENSSKSLKPNTNQNTNHSKNSKRPLRRQSFKPMRNSASGGRKPFQAYQKQKHPSRQPQSQQKENQSSSKKQE